MIRITKAVLRRPVTTLLVILSIVFFGVISIFNTKLELTPEISMPMFIIQTTYVGAAPADVDELISKPIEDHLATLGSVDSITSQSYENYGITLVQYEYGTDMDNAYSELRKKLDLARASLPEDAKEPLIMELNIDQLSAMYICVNNSAINNIYNYAEKNVVPEFEKLTAVASVGLSGGNKEYISIELIPEKVSQYRLDINTVAALAGSASYTMPAGSTRVGDTDMAISSGVSYDTVESLKRIPITAGNGNLLYLEDIAVISRAQEDSSTIGRYNGNDTVLLTIERNQQYTAVDVSNQVRDTITELKESDPNLDFVIVEDTADQIKESLYTMLETMAAAIAISTVILILFYGDLKASLIVATSIPLAILTGFILIWSQGYSMNIITLGSLVLGVGMMVDNSIVVLESCFRVMEDNPGRGFGDYIHAAVRGTEIVAASIFGSTLTTCVVFIPLIFTGGLANQFFKPMSLTIVFCMLASLISAISVVPLCFVFYKPVEKEKAPAYKLIRSMQAGYRRLMGRLMEKKKAVIGVTLALFGLAVFLAFRLDMSLMPDMDQGTVMISVNLKPNLTAEESNKVIDDIEEIISTDEDLEDYMSMSGSSSLLSAGGSASVTCYLKDGRKKTTAQTVKKWKKELQAVSNCDIAVSSYSYTSTMNVGSGFSVTMVNPSYDALKKSADAIKTGLMGDSRVTGVSSSLDNASPIIKITVDPVAAAAEGFVPAQVSSSLYVMMTGVEADTMEIDGTELSVRVEYPSDEYDELNEVENIRLTGSSGNTVFVKDIAEVNFQDSPMSITRTDKQYSCEISASYTELADSDSEDELTAAYVTPNLTNGTRTVKSALVEMLENEFDSLYIAIAVAVFLVFVVMAAQFESPRFSFMVMSTIPFAMIGSFGLLWLFNIPLTMPALVGFIMLTGTVVNNGILYIDTVNQYRQGDYDGAPADENGEPVGMELKEALIEAGATRLRPILMTTLTTVLSMLPMCIFAGGGGALMQGLAMVEVGGLITSTVMALLVLPIYYELVNGKKGKRHSYAELSCILLLAGALSLTCSFPAKAESPAFARTEEEWKTLNDNTLEWQEIDGLVSEFNATVKANNSKYNEDKLRAKTAEQTASSLNGMADSYEALASAAEGTDGGAVKAASYRLQADQLRSQADENVSDYRILLLENERMKRQLTEDVRQLFVGYHSAVAAKEQNTRKAAYMERAYNSAKNLQKYGMGTEIDTLTALENLQRAQADLVTADTDINAGYKKLITMCGWKYDAQADVAALPEIDLATVAAVDETKDREAALKASITLQEDAIRLENAGSLYGDTVVKKWSDQTAIDTNTVKNSYNTALSALRLAKDTYDSAAAQAKIQNENLARAVKQLNLGAISRMEYATAEYTADSAKAAMDNAYADLILKRAAYDAVVNGLS